MGREEKEGNGKGRGKTRYWIGRKEDGILGVKERYGKGGNGMEQEGRRVEE